jgi:uncharacterized membrane protein
MYNFIFLISAIVLFSIDFIYLTVIRSYFDWQIRKVQGSPMKINIWSAALCYILLIVGFNYFIIKPKRSHQDAFLLGLVIYGVFETTNYALFSNWSLMTVIIDTLWGGILFALTSYIVNYLRNVF